MILIRNAFREIGLKIDIRRERKWSVYKVRRGQTMLAADVHNPVKEGAGPKRCFLSVNDVWYRKKKKKKKKVKTIPLDLLTALSSRVVESASINDTGENCWEQGLVRLGGCRCCKKARAKMKGFVMTSSFAATHKRRPTAFGAQKFQIEITPLCRL